MIRKNLSTYFTKLQYNSWLLKHLRSLAGCHKEMTDVEQNEQNMQIANRY